MTATDPQDACKLLLDAALRHAAADNKIDLETMLAQPYGRRRSYHDDITIVVVSLEK